MPRGANPTRESGRSVSALLTGGLWASAELAEYMVLIGLFSSYTYYVDQDTRRVFTRRRVLAGAGAGALVAGSVAADSMPSGLGWLDRLSDRHQVGIDTPPLPFLSMAGFDVVTENRGGLVSALRRLTDAVAMVTGGRPNRLTATIGFGPSLFVDDRFGILDRRPAALVPLPSFAGEALDPTQSDGDLCVQVCATHPATAHHAIRTVVSTLRPYARLRWRQTGFRPGDGADPPGLLGFRDGTANIGTSDEDAMRRHVWVHDEGSWMHGGTYLVVRRIRLLLDTWDRLDVSGQEAVVGRTQHTNERLDGPATAHVTLAAPVTGNRADPAALLCLRRRC